MRIWHISDTHGNHEKLDIPRDIDIVIHSGDASNSNNPVENLFEFAKFFEWFESVNIPNKVFVPGNHETSIARGLFPKQNFADSGIHFLQESSVTLNGLNIWGSPITPTYGQWAFMVSRHKTDRYWQSIPADTNIIVTHGPPFGVLDATYDVNNNYDLCGDRALQKRVFALNPKLMCFGHIHNCKDIVNSGTKTVSGKQTIFSNASCSTDGKRGVLTSNGNVITI